MSFRFRKKVFATLCVVVFVNMTLYLLVSTKPMSFLGDLFVDKANRATLSLQIRPTTTEDRISSNSGLRAVQVRNQQRQRTVQEFCTSRSLDITPFSVPSNIRLGFSFSDRLQLVFCSIQKVGTSFWERVMKVMNGQVPQEEFLLSFHHEAGIRGYYSLANKTQAQMEKILRSYRKFMFVRDPYARLFSAYMDKVFLPSHRTLVISHRKDRMLKHTVKKEEEEEEEEEGAEEQVQQQEQCPPHVSFETFLEVIVQGYARDQHWYPMHEHCSPCSVGFDYIGKLETFSEDAEFILREAGTSLASLTSNVDSLESDTELTTITDRSREVFAQADYNHCSADPHICEVFKKIWIVLQTRGYLSKHIPYPFPTRNCKSVKKSDFVSHLAYIYKTQAGSLSARKSQRKEAMMEAFYSLPRWLLKKVEDYVRDDCTMFGYECSVDVRFPLDNATQWKMEYFRQFG